uniref:Uncharacterized protein n=1 Tax=Timema poppense TaxID=170557 RepID=A0A7R9HA59_TIMPO|nr:unnamed protein product [Timema poppensis]
MELESSPLMMALSRATRMELESSPLLKKLSWEELEESWTLFQESMPPISKQEISMEQSNNASVEQKFSSINNFWSSEESSMSTACVKALLVVQMNCSQTSCTEMYENIKKNKNLLKDLASSDKYDWREPKPSYSSARNLENEINLRAVGALLCGTPPPMTQLGALHSDQSSRAQHTTRRAMNTLVVVFKEQRCLGRANLIRSFFP